MAEPSAQPSVVTVLPPRERFAPGQAGAIALLVRRMAVPGERVVGAPVADVPFDTVAFHPVPQRWGLSASDRYARGVCAAVASWPDAVIEVHNRPDLAVRVCRRFPDRPVTLVLHNDPQGMRQARTAAERTRLLRLMAVYAVSPWIMSRFSDGVAGPDIARALLGVRPNAIDAVDVPSINDRQPLILFVGRMVADKGADAFVRACRAVLPTAPGWRARMIGADRFGDDSPMTPFLRALEPQAHAAGVELAGYQPHAAVLHAMAQASVVVVPSRWPEPFGMTALEAMACGAAVIGGTRGALPDVIGEAGVCVDPDVPDALEHALTLLLNDAPRRRALGDAGRARALGLFGAGHVREEVARQRCAVRDWKRALTRREVRCE
ncbi:hexosyltransferase [Ameyamaea chiangmaiensis NBRC 103196]|uniref:glycosyltransferase family 4 protein n=1 Tax=Ameyamaea chiangmaiensis TaxID=442969 RepID=UPI001FE304B6|nr:glycosyltransferase family 4 protein [Ameyamaea chiangmaiensis]GBQ67879.1 hexosyltransferase [Ameyamaea chiangmaiensis NBRC 103196]